MGSSGGNSQVSSVATREAIGTPLALGSRWALLPAALGVIVLMVRTVLEDGTLQAELAGYADYTQRVRSRLVPYVW